MPSTHTKVRKRKAKSKTATRSRKSSHPRKSTLRSGSHPRRKTVAKQDDVTYVYECTRPGCGYKIWRDEKGEQGQLRNDLKCPKCHHIEFRCLGKGDLPESFQVPIPTNPVDFDAVKTSEIWSN
ncbi:hypothetical protein E6H34_09695 [Candidatus Bathyarchaeota archaeon]|nr:MAG: hypothetical protein E6H34_09695 [Candidatus Bathyarchaeota archaeon]